MLTHPYTDPDDLPLLRACLRAAREPARPGTSSANLALQKAAEAVGFVVVSRTLHFYRQVT
jgi:hypothetical protein